MLRSVQMTSDYDYLLKVIIVGDSNVGKSSLMEGYVNGRIDSEYIPTIGIDFKTKKISVGAETCKLQIWDTAGQERFRSIISAYYKGAHVVLIVFDVTNRESFNNIPRWIRSVRNHCVDNQFFVLVANKTDLRSTYSFKGHVTSEEIKELAESLGFDMFFEASAKTGGLDDIFAKSAEGRNIKYPRPVQKSESKFFILQEPLTPSYRCCNIL